MRKFSCLIACLLCLSCLRDPSAPNNEPGAPLLFLGELTGASVTLNGWVQYPSEELIYGFVITDLVNGDSQESRAVLKEDKTFSWTAELSKGTTYSARAYVSNGLSRKYSKSLMITTPASSKATVSSVTLTDGFLSAVLKDDGGRKIEDLGFVWGTSPERKQLLREKKIPAEVIDGNRFTQSLRPFEVGQTYYILAYAIDDNEDVGYSPEPLELTLTEDDYVHFEDPNFEAQVLKRYDRNKDGKMAYGEMMEITKLSVNTDNVVSVQEISLMHALQEFFCEGSAPQKGKLNHLDLTVVPQLTALSCAGNQLKILDISPCPDMVYLIGLDNPLDTVFLAATQHPKTLGVPKNTVVFYLISGFSLKESFLSMLTGDSYQLTPVIDPEGTVGSTVTWTSSDTQVVTVSPTGLLTAHNAGSCTITGECYGKTASCEVTVTTPVGSITLNKTTLSLVEEESETLIATITPSDATDKTVIWASSNSQVASVDQDGKVTALKEGVASITATAGGKSTTCIVSVNKQFVPVSKITLSKSSLELIKGTYEVLTAIVEPEDATDKTLIWSSSDEDIAVVSNTGRVSAFGVGSAIITVKAGEQTATCDVLVTVPVSSITLNKTYLTLVEGQSETLVATVMPDDATDKSLTWTSSNEDIAVVSNTGRVTAIGGGSAIITVKAGEKTATCTVQVTVPVTSITLNKTSLTLVEEQSETLIATVMPADATDKTVTWASSNSQVASVDQDGKVAALKEGVASITATAGGKTATCQVTVNKKFIPVTRIILNKSSLELAKGTYEVLTATVEPEDATYKTVTWSSSNPDVATVNNEGRVTAIGGGAAKITAIVGDQTASCTVQVAVPVTNITLNKTSLTLVEEQSETLIATVMPADATAWKTWTSSNTSVATVDQNGTVVAVKEGVTSITATAGGKSATCNVTVNSPFTQVTSVSFTETEREVYIGEVFTITATVYPDDATDKSLIWESSSTSVATVSNEGQVTPVGKGDCIITATAKSGVKASFTCNVVSEAPVFTDAVFKEYILTNFDIDRDGFLSRAEALAIRSVNIYEAGISSLTGIEFLSNLSNLYCGSNPISTLDLSKNYKLTWLECTMCDLAKLDLSNNTQLEYVNCCYNQLTQLNFTGLSKLCQIICQGNPLSSLSVLNCTRLLDIYCQDTDLTELDLSTNNKLQVLNCQGDKYLSQLKTGNSPELSTLVLDGCPLDSIDTSLFPNLINLVCTHNSKLHSLDVRNNLSLVCFYCYNCPSLTDIWLKDGQSIEFFDYDEGVNLHYEKNWQA